MMRYLVDTHAVLWWLMDAAALPQSWRLAMSNPQHSIALSSASIMEMAIKSSIGKLSLPDHLLLTDIGAQCGFESLPITVGHAAAFRRLPLHHRDPFDRILVAQAQCEQRILISADSQLRRYDVPILAGA